MSVTYENSHVTYIVLSTTDKVFSLVINIAVFVINSIMLQSGLITLLQQLHLQLCSL